MPRFAANLSFLFTELPFPERFAAAAAAGFGGVEFLFPYAWPVEAVAGWRCAAGVDSVLFNLPPGDWEAGERGLACLPGREDDDLTPSFPFITGDLSFISQTLVLPALVPLGLVIESALGNMFNYTASQRGDIGRTLPGHARILAAIRGRKPNAARLAVRQLLRDTARVVEQVTAPPKRPRAAKA